MKVVERKKNCKHIVILSLDLVLRTRKYSTRIRLEECRNKQIASIIYSDMRSRPVGMDRDPIQSFMALFLERSFSIKCASISHSKTHSLIMSLTFSCLPYIIHNRDYSIFLCYTDGFTYYRKYILQITQPSQYRSTQLQYRFAVISDAPSKYFFCAKFV